MSEIHNATGGNADAPSTAGVTIESLRALLAQRDGELEALRGKVAAAEQDLREIAVEYGGLLDHNLGVLLDGVLDKMRAALSDNQESPAFTDKEG